ncbi:MAG: MFS transporter [Thalassospira sp.]|uniref:MFS transporter n=1 Tax=Thalassospira sp. GB04J01 TaxID=1485225 RepID=UPI000C11014B|nr:MFS transporter [Thalassospira sp. GB04J01]MBV17425.1 MFS transporter [Thalassospira sp.]|tara:strand:- start:587 stop:1801 length:1215 start_codon:yes stop_codon:yes gene_type:complete
MSVAQKIIAQADETPTPSRTIVFALAFGAGSAVASIYYTQPVLNLISSELNIGLGTTGLIPTLTMTGYALGILFLSPLGDRYDRRMLIVLKSIFLAAMLFLGSLSNSLNSLLLTGLMIGVAATLAQDIVPAAAILAPKERQGKTIGTVMTGLLVGILLSRTISGFIADQFGWRLVFQLAAVDILIVALALWKILPKFKIHAQMSYGGLLLSLAHLWKQHAELRSAALAQAFLAVAFSAFWSTLSMILDQHYQLGSDVAGAFGLLGAAGALMARYAGVLSDHHGPAMVTRLGASLLIASFVAMSFVPFLPGTTAQLILLALGTIGFDLGMQAALVSHQTIVYRIAPEARSRLNAVLFTVMFIGMASGSALGTQLFAMAGYQAVIGLGIVAGLISLIIRFRAHSSQ